MAFSCSCAVEVSFFALEGRLCLSISESGWRRGAGTSSRTAWCRLAALPVPGCLKIPKFLGDGQWVDVKLIGLMWTNMDFLCGWILHEMVFPSSTLTQRTM